MKKLILLALILWGCDYAPTEHTHDTTHEHDDVYGCTDSTACNYNNNATIHDGTCDYGFQYNLQFTVDEFVNTDTTFNISTWVTNVGDTTITSNLGFTMELFANNSRIFQYARHDSSVEIVPFTPQLWIFEINNYISLSLGYNLEDFKISNYPDYRFEIKPYSSIGGEIITEGDCSN